MQDSLFWQGFFESFDTKAIFPAFSTCCILRQSPVDFLVYSTFAFLTRVLGLSRYCAKRFISTSFHRHLLILTRRFKKHSHFAEKSEQLERRATEAE